MTRLNLLPVALLTNKHLMAEYHELPRVFSRVQWRIDRGQRLADLLCKISKSYTLNTGHETFFNDKLAWVYARYEELYLELLARGYNLDHGKYAVIREAAFSLANTEWWQDYSPTPEEVYLNMARLVRRSNLAPVLAEASATN